MKVVRSVAVDACRDSLYSDALADADSVVIDTNSNSPNVAISCRLDGKLVQDEFDADSRDLIDLATCIYVCDEVVPRALARDYWTRDFQLVVPVSTPARWQAATLGLVETLRFLSGDHWSFSWASLRKTPIPPKHRVRLPREVDAVCLFSGGMDSFLGAVQLLAAGRRVVLVGHHAEGATAEAQARLIGTLRRQYSGRVWFFQASILRSRRERPMHSLPPPTENTHRVRSFLFLSLALALARTLNVSEVFIPENGMIAINAPTQVSRMGSCSTRTAHPRYLIDLQTFLRNSDLYSGAIRNPFLFKSKTDMVVETPRALHGTLLGSISCARPNRYKNLQVRHCGYCIPCIYRRVALAAVGIDRQSDYAFSVFDNPTLIRDEKGADLRALAAFARTIVATSPSRLDDVVLSHGFFPTTVGADFGPEETTTYEPWSKMLLRWAQGFLKAGAKFDPEVRRVLGIPTAPQRRR